MPSNADGVVALRGKHWFITGKPHMLFRAERSILNASRKDGAVRVPATGEGATDVFWFAQRFNLEIQDQKQLRGDAGSFALAHSQADRILLGKFTTDLSGFRPGEKPREYQSQAAQLWKSVKGLLLADDLGLGKTLTSLIALTDPALRPGIVVSYPNLSTQWQDSIHRFFYGMKTHVIKQNAYYDLPQYRKCDKCNTWSLQKVTNGRVAQLGTCRKCRRSLTGETSGPDVFLLSYHKLHSWADILGPICKSVIYDEVQELRRTDSRKYEAAHRLSRMVDYRIGASATPVHNMGGEMYNVMDCLMPGALGTKGDFRKTWCLSEHRAGKEPALTDPAAFGEYLRSQHLMIRRTREEVGRELPAHTRVVHPIDADASSIDVIKGRAGDLARLILGGNSKPAEQMNAAGQLESIVRQQTGIAKAPYVAAFVDMILQQGTPVVLFGYHLAVYEIWTRLLRDHNPLMYTGQESTEKKRENKDRFCVGDSNLLIVSLASGAGLDGLQHRCATGVMGELDWSPAKHSQAEGRYHRDGQKLPCMTYYLVCEFGLDPVMTETLGVKRAQSAGLLKSDDMGAISRNSQKYVRALAESFIKSAH